MALDTLSTVVPAGPDKIAGKQIAEGFIEAVLVVDRRGDEVDIATSAQQDVGNSSLAAIEGFFRSEDTAAASGDKGLVMLAQRYAADTPTTDADGDYTILKLDEEGRLKVATKPASYADITGDITAVQATIGTPVAGGTVAGDVSRASNLMIFCTGTFAGINCTFEGSLQDTGETNWFAVQAVRSNANTIELATGVLSAQPAYAWEASVNALKRFRVRATARTSGTQSWRFVQGTYATEPIPAAQVSGTQPVSGSVTTTAAATANLMGDVGLQNRANATGAASTAKIASAATTNATNIKNTAGRVVGWSLANTTATLKVLRFYNLNAAPTVGTSASLFPVYLPPGGRSDVSLPAGIAFTTGISYAITGGLTDLDNTATAANDVLGSVFYA